MRIKVINPDYGKSPEALRQRERMLSSIARRDTEISMECVTNTKVEIDSALDVVVAGAEIVNLAIKAEKDGFDAIVLYCLSDPAIVACRESVSIPVVGGGQASMLIACSLGYRFSLITTSKRRITEKEESIRYLGIDPYRLASVRSVDISLTDSYKSIEDTVNRLVKVGKECVDKDGAQVLVLGCLSYAGMSEEVSSIVGVPVVDPAFAAINMAELLYAQKLSHSKIAYPYPPVGERSWSCGQIII